MNLNLRKIARDHWYTISAHFFIPVDKIFDPGDLAMMYDAEEINEDLYEELSDESAAQNYFVSLFEHVESIFDPGDHDWTEVEVREIEGKYFYDYCIIFGGYPHEEVWRESWRRIVDTFSDYRRYAMNLQCWDAESSSVEPGFIMIDPDGRLGGWRPGGDYVPEIDLEMFDELEP